MTTPTHEEVEALAKWADALKFSMYPAHGSGLVEIVTGDKSPVEDPAKSIATTLRALDVERQQLRAQLASARNAALKEAVAICAERESATLSKQGQAVARLIGKAIRSLISKEG